VNYAQKIVLSCCPKIGGNFTVMVRMHLPHIYRFFEYSTISLFN